MLVETYEVTETGADGAVEIEAEALELIESLGLSGQQSLVRAGGEEPRRIPYQQMKPDEVRVYKALYPQEVKLERYDAGPIPVRVLQVIAFARDLFDMVVIWAPQQHDPDPVLVGFTNRPDVWHRGVPHLLARWGDALDPYPELRERAEGVMAATFEDKAREKRREADIVLADPKAEASRWLRTGEGSASWVSA